MDDRKSEYKNEYKVEPRSKATLAYWENAIFCRRPGGNWWAQIQYKGSRKKVPLGTLDKALGAKRARSFYLSLSAKGWDQALADLKGIQQSGERSSSDCDLTVGELLAELQAKADLKPKTLESYAKALRKIISDCFGFGDSNQKCDYRSGGWQTWQDQVHAVKLSELTPGRVQIWKRDFLGKAGDDPSKQRSAKTSFNSFLRRAKSLFAPETIKHLSIKLPSPLPFDGIRFEPKQSTLYRSSFDASQLLETAQKELSETDPAVFLVILLALCLGLRKGEIDLLPWSAVHFSEGVLRIEPTEYFEVKTEHSIGDVPVEPEIIEILRGFKARNASPFVVPSHRPPKRTATYNYYRCEPIFDRALLWLRAQGVTAKTPIHTLRKECGSLVNKNHGLATAKEVLRHSNIAITAAHYVENRKRGTTGLGALLKVTGDKKIASL
jgi:integrase